MSYGNRVLVICCLAAFLGLTSAATANDAKANAAAKGKAGAVKAKTGATKAKVDAYNPQDETINGKLTWLDDYAEATDRAERQNKMLFVLFVSADEKGESAVDNAHYRAISRPEVQKKLKKFVRVLLPVDATITMNGQKVQLLQLDAFSEMNGGAGMAIVDFSNNNPKLRGDIVSMFPLYRGQPFTAKQIAVMLGLPSGTLTQRTLIYAVRTHPEAPASANGEELEDLAEEAESHSCYQAAIQSQGHHRWGSRFQRICAKLTGGLMAREVCAESWPNQGLLAAAIDCVSCWRQSSGHWSAVRANHPCYGYDMKRGRNGIWYATGIFGCR